MEHHLHELIRFLHEHKAYEAFYYNMLHVHEAKRQWFGSSANKISWYEQFAESIKNGCRVDQLIGNSFPWEETKEGPPYWNNLFNLASSKFAYQI